MCEILLVYSSIHVFTCVCVIAIWASICIAICVLCVCVLN